MPAQPLSIDITTWPDAQNPRRKDPVPPGQFSYGTSINGGPAFTDPFQSRRAPSPWQLVENYNSLIYAMVARNRDAITRLPLRLYADGSRAQGGKPRSACDPIECPRHVGQRLARAGMVSESAIDQVYEIRTHPFLDTLDRPDPYGYFDKQKLIGAVVAYMDVVGWSIIVPEGGGWDWRKPNNRAKGPPEYLWVVYPQYTTPVRYGQSPLINFFQYFADKLPFTEVMWFRHNISLRDAYASAFSPTYAAETYRLLEQEQVQTLSQVLGLGPRPNMIFTAKDSQFTAGENERKRFEQDLNRRQAAGNAGGVLVSNGAYEATPINYSPADMAGEEMAKYAIYAMAAIFGQPATYYTVDSNLANLQAADAQHARMGVEPRCRSIEGTLNWLVKSWDPRLFVRFDPALPEDEVARQQVVDMQLKSGQITINEANEEARWPDKPYGDAAWLPGTLRQPDMITAEHEQSLEQQKTAMDSMSTGDELAADGQEHQQKMDKAGHELQKKQLAQKSESKTERSTEQSIEELCRMVLTAIGQDVGAV